MEIKSFTIHDSGDPQVGIMPTQYELTGGFFFEEPEHLPAFKDDLAKLFSEAGFIQGRVIVTTDVEDEQRASSEYEHAKENTDAAFDELEKSSNKFWIECRHLNRG